MKIAILGAGTAGFMAAAHLTRFFPDIELVHIFDPNIGTIGVGEGTTPGFRSWLAEIAPVEFETLQRECDATRKNGIRFEGWGNEQTAFCNDFYPQDKSALHISAGKLITFLSDYVNVDPTPGHVSCLEPDAESVRVKLEDGTSHTVQLVIDARGFPAVLDPKEHHSLSWIPTNAALVTGSAPVANTTRTRAVARPCGWIFVIPLTERTSYGYVYNHQCDEIGAVEDDFAKFLDEDGVTPHGPSRALRFPNFVCHEPFQGRVCKIGNAASFIEPLEATSIAVVKSQLELLTPWLKLSASGSATAMSKALVTHVSRDMRDLVLELSLFVAWHYGMGSIHQTRFWERAQSGFHKGLVENTSETSRRKFAEHLKHADGIPIEKLVLAHTTDDLNRILPEQMAFPKPFGGMSPIGFAQLKQGIGDVDLVSMFDSEPV